MANAEIEMHVKREVTVKGTEHHNGPKSLYFIIILINPKYGIEGRTRLVFSLFHRK